MIRVANWPGELQFEAGGVGKLGEFVDGLGAGRALVVCGKTVAGGEMLERVRAGLGSRCAGVFDGAQMHTPLVTVLEAANLFLQEKADLIISVGGGSAVDTGKGIALMIAGGGELEPYRLKETPHRPLPPCHIFRYPRSPARPVIFCLSPLFWTPKPKPRCDFRTLCWSPKSPSWMPDYPPIAGPA